MTDFTAQRLNMVDSQVRTNDVTDLRLQQAMLAVPRERFVPPVKQALAYMDGPIDVAPGRALLDARCFAKLAQLAAIRSTDTVLDVGCATGYSAAVLSRLAGRVVALEQDPALAAVAEETLTELGIANVAVVRGSLKAGYAAEAPYDVIFVNGSTGERPETLLEQLRDGGRLVCVVTTSLPGRAHLFVRNKDAVGARVAFDAQVAILPGFEKPRAFVF